MEAQFLFLESEVFPQWVTFGRPPCGVFLADPRLLPEGFLQLSIFGFGTQT